LDNILLNQNITNCDGVVSLWDSLYYAESITEFDFSNNGLSGSIPSEIGLFTNLNYLDLSNNNLNGSIPNELGDLSNLEYLNFAFNQLSGSIPNSIGNLISLKELRLFQNELTGSIPNELGNLGELIHINLRNNNLTGSIPSNLANLNLLEILYLHNNQLSGNIPTGIFGLTNLKRIFLNNNQLSGSISSNISDLISINKFRVESNNITGVIPQEICNMNLEWEDSISFNISNNQFCAPYPFCVQDFQGYQDTINCGSMNYFEKPSVNHHERIKAYPNPFNPQTTIYIEMGAAGRVKIDIIDLLGKKVKTLFSGRINSGLHSIQWYGKSENGRNIGPGIYFCIVNTEYSKEVIKLIMLK
jgi:hypothetical protein